MSENNPYEAPDSDVHVDVEGEAYQAGFFITSRIGRIRYLAYNTLALLALTASVGVFAGVFGAFGSPEELGTVAIVLLLILYFAAIAYAVVLTRRRLNDIDLTGWIAIAYFVPIANIILGLCLAFWPGTKGSNRYGPAPDANSTALWVLGLLMPVFLIGIMASVAIPAYQDYVEAAQGAANSE